MKMTRRQFLRLATGATALGAVVAAAVVAGELLDRDPENPFARFQPSDVDARAALQAALQAWQQGQPTGRIPGPEIPAVYLVDNTRRPQQALETFTILGEAAGDGPRCYAVRVALKNPEEESRIRFVVYGCDPIWVYRYEDYEMLMHWECGRDEAIKATAAKAASPPTPLPGGDGNMKSSER